MELIPAIDLMEGAVVRLRRGQFQHRVAFGNDPVKWACQAEAVGCNRLHIVDLDGARQGRLVHWDVIASICTRTRLSVQVGGGIRDLATVEKLRTLGVARVIVGTRAQDVSWLKEVVHAIEGQVLVALDIRRGRWVVQGWQREAGVATEWIQRWRTVPFLGYLITDTARDGTLSGVDLQKVRRWLTRVDRPVWWAGGFRDTDDVRQAIALHHPHLRGIVLGRAWLEGKIDFHILKELL